MAFHSPLSLGGWALQTRVDLEQAAVLVLGSLGEPALQWNLLLVASHFNRDRTNWDLTRLQFEAGRPCPHEPPQRLGPAIGTAR